MAFDISALAGNVGTGGTTPTVYKYNTEDDYNLVQSGGYFNDADLSLEVNDIIHAETSDAFAILRVTNVNVRPVTVNVSYVEVI